MIPREWFFWWVDHFGWIISCFDLTSSLPAFIWLVLFVHVITFFSSSSFFTATLVRHFFNFCCCYCFFFFVFTFSFFSLTTRAYIEKGRSWNKRTCVFSCVQGTILLLSCWKIYCELQLKHQQVNTEIFCTILFLGIVFFESPCQIFLFEMVISVNAI